MAYLHIAKTGREPSGNTYKAIVVITGQAPRTVYRASIGGAYSGAQTIINNAWDNGSSADVTVTIYHKPFSRTPWEQVDAQRVSADGTVKC